MSQEQKEAFCRDVVKEKRLENTQYIFVEHKDTDYKHLHLMYNKTDNKGKGIHQDKNAIDDNLMGYKLGLKYDFSIPEKTRVYVERELSRNPEFLEQVYHRQRSGKAAPLVMVERGKFNELKAREPLLAQARNEHHLKRLCLMEKKAFRQEKKNIHIGDQTYDRGLVQGLLFENNSVYLDKKRADKKVHFEKSMQENRSKGDHLQKMEKRQARELERERVERRKQQEKLDEKKWSKNKDRGFSL
jgi:hypothetical protein